MKSKHAPPQKSRSKFLLDKSLEARQKSVRVLLGPINPGLVPLETCYPEGGGGGSVRICVVFLQCKKPLDELVCARKCNIHFVNNDQPHALKVVGLNPTPATYKNMA